MFTLLFRLALETGGQGGQPVYALPSNTIRASVTAARVARVLDVAIYHEITTEAPVRRLTFEG